MVIESIECFLYMECRVLGIYEFECLLLILLIKNEGKIY